MWLPLTIDHVRARMTDHEIACYEAGGDENSATRLDDPSGIIDQVTLLVRGKVAACKDNLLLLGSSGTIPEELLWAATTIARHSLAATIPNVDELQGDRRVEEYRDAMKQLEQAASCKLAIAGPDSDTPPATASCYGSYPQHCF